MSPLRLNGSTSGYSQLDAPAVAGDQTFTLPGTGGTLDRINRAGNVLQVVNGVYATPTSSSSGTFADTGLTATITPTSASSKILVCVTQAGCFKDTSNTALQLRLLRSSSVLYNFENEGGITASSATSGIGTCAFTYLDSPASTSPVVYKTQLASSANSPTVSVQVTTSTSSITLMEIAA